MTDLQGLHPDLAPYIKQGPHGRYINHPLVQVKHLDLSLPDDAREKLGYASQVEFANIRLAEKRDTLATAIKERDWITYVFAHERPYRFDAIRDITGKGYATIHDLWPVIGATWFDSENIRQYSDEWLSLWRMPSERKREAMDKDERAAWDKLPDVLKIYRGVNCAEEWEAVDAFLGGLSWTMYQPKAVWFAQRGSAVPWVAEATVKKRDCFAYFTVRNEWEIVIDPNKLGKWEYKKERKAR